MVLVAVSAAGAGHSFSNSKGGNMTEEVHHRRGGGRAARQVTRNSSNAQRDAYLTRSIKPYEMVSDEDLELLEHNADLEQQLVDHYAEATRFCATINDEANGAFFQSLLEDEQHHSRDLEAWLQQLGGRRRRGYALYGANTARRDPRSRATF